MKIVFNVFVFELFVNVFHLKEKNKMKEEILLGVFNTAYRFSSWLLKIANRLRQLQLTILGGRTRRL